VQVSQLQLYTVVDPHLRRPPAWGIYGFDPDDILYVLDEYPNVEYGHYSQNKKAVYYEQIKDRRFGYKEEIRAFYELEQKWGGNIIKRFIDPRHGATKVANTNRTVMEEYRVVARDQGIDMRFYKAVVGTDSGMGEIASGVHLIQERLKHDVDLGIPPGIFINPNCQNHDRMFKYHKYRNRTGKAAEGRGISEEFEEKYKDHSDLLRYLLKSVKGYKQPRTYDHEESRVYRPTVSSITGY